MVSHRDSADESPKMTVESCGVIACSSETSFASSIAIKNICYSFLKYPLHALKVSQTAEVSANLQNNPDHQPRLAQPVFQTC